MVDGICDCTCAVFWQYRPDGRGHMPSSILKGLSKVRSNQHGTNKLMGQLNNWGNLCEIPGYFALGPCWVRSYLWKAIQNPAVIMGHNTILENLNNYLGTYDAPRGKSQISVTFFLFERGTCIITFLQHNYSNYSKETLTININQQSELLSFISFF